MEHRWPRLTDKDKRVIRAALNDAMDERASFADAYSYTGPEAEGAMKRVREYEALHVKLFGERSARAKFSAECEAMPTVSLRDLMAPGK